MKLPYHQDLDQFRQAAVARDPQPLHFLLKKQLQSLDYYVALAVVTERLYNFLDIFESYYPEEEWVRKLLVSIVSFGTAPDDRVATMAMQQSFSEPGAANYLKAIFDLTQSMQDHHTGEARIGFMASAIVNAIMAELVEAWYGLRPVQWQAVREAQSNPEEDHPEATDIALSFWLNDETAALDTACWLEIADSLEAKLKRQYGNEYKDYLFCKKRPSKW